MHLFQELNCRLVCILHLCSLFGFLANILRLAYFKPLCLIWCVGSWHVCCRKFGATWANFWDVNLWDRFLWNRSFSSCLECFVRFEESWVFLSEIFRTFWKIPSQCFLTSLCQKLIEHIILVARVVILTRVCNLYLFKTNLRDQKFLIFGKKSRKRSLKIKILSDSHAFLLVLFKWELSVDAIRIFI